MRMARKPSAVARELLRNFPRGGRRRRRRSSSRTGGGDGGNGQAPEREKLDAEAADEGSEADKDSSEAESAPSS
jgi:hypothetical protein